MRVHPYACIAVRTPDLTGDAMSNPSTAGLRRWGTIPQAVDHSGRSRSRLYEWAREHEGLFLKDGASTIVDFSVLDRILEELPAAKIG
jgi:hypothetical protein